MEVGLYFGSFNPVHHGHLIIAKFMAENTPLNQVWFVISPQNPFKTTTSLLNEYHRLHLVRSAIEGEDELKTSDIEFHLPKPSYTIDTLAYLQEKYPQHTFSIIMGSDSFQNLPKWKNAEIIMERYQLYIYTRPGFEVQLPHPKNVTVVDAPLLQISATQIREMIKHGKSVRYLVPDVVMNEIVSNSYYRQ